jgi:S-adenosylmethionine decarboxylase
MSEQDTIQFGVHYMLDGYGADHDLLEDIPKLTKVLHDVPANMGMHTISEPVVVKVGPKNRKDPGGVSGFVLIAESHVSFHTFPKRGFITIDVYTCQERLDSDKLTAEFIKAFKITNHHEMVVQRGMLYPKDNIYE